MKLPNNYGSITKLKGNRRKPYMVRLSKESYFDEKKGKAVQVRPVLGYYETRAKALQALAKYNDDPYDIDKARFTFEQLYDLWSEKHYKNIAKSTQGLWKSAFNNSKPLHKMVVREIKHVDLEKAIDSAPVGNPTKINMRTLYGMMYKFAIKHEMVTNDISIGLEFKEAKTEKRTAIPFTNKEINTLWNNVEVPFVDMVLINLYSGWRPGEMTALETKNIDLKNKIMKGGMKTRSGINRLVPIHSRILPLIEKHYDKNRKFLFSTRTGRDGFTYVTYFSEFNKLMEKFEMNHSPRDPRHTFISNAKKNKVNEYILKLIVGHSIKDLTEKVYTHRTIKELQGEINKVNYGLENDLIILNF